MNLDFVVEKSLRTAILFIHDTSGFPYTLTTYVSPTNSSPGIASLPLEFSRYMKTHSAPKRPWRTFRTHVHSFHEFYPNTVWPLIKFCSQLRVLRVLRPYSYALKQNIIPAGESITATNWWPLTRLASSTSPIYQLWWHVCTMHPTAHLAATSLNEFTRPVHYI